MLRAALAALALTALLVPATAQAQSRHAQCLRCTPEQRDAFRTSEELVHRLWLESRRAHQTVKKVGATDERVRHYLEQLQASFTDAWRAHEAFVATLGEQHSETLSTRLDRIGSVRRTTLDNFDELEEILGESPPDQTRSNWRFGRIARAMRDWIRQNERLEWHADW